VATPAARSSWRCDRHTRHLGGHRVGACHCPAGHRAADAPRPASIRSQRRRTDERSPSAIGRARSLPSPSPSTRCARISVSSNARPTPSPKDGSTTTCWLSGYRGRSVRHCSVRSLACRI
jgi:hypothetical protein